MTDVFLRCIIFSSLHSILPSEALGSWLDWRTWKILHDKQDKEKGEEEIGVLKTL
jgi:hypothetical protein